MPQKVIGGPTTNTKELFHYSDSPKKQFKPNKFWTEFGTLDSSQAKRATGSTNKFNYRMTVLVNGPDVYEHFTDAGTRSETLTLEFKNKKAITEEYIKVDKMTS